MTLNIPTSVPVFIQTTESDAPSNGKFTKAKLKIFYIGETSDHRVFTSAFSDKLLESLPYTPVVGFYDSEDEDFKGHNTTQYIYGVVPENPTISEETDDKGHVFKVTDVYLYTERQDNIGEVASKIVGKQHSLELDPNTVKYIVHRDAFGRFRNLEFTEGQLVGLSVLGDNEHPAFSGSSFFSDETNSSVFEQMRDSQDKYIEFLQNTDGGNKELQINEFEETPYANVLEFLKHTYEEKQNLIYAALTEREIYGQVVDMTDDSAIVHYWDNETDTPIYGRFAYSIVDDKAVIGEPVRVYARYLTEDEIAALENPPAPQPEFNDKGQGDGSNGEPQTKDTDPAPAAPEQMGEPAPSFSSTTLTDAERAELENFRKHAKLNLIASYKNDLPQDILDEFSSKVDELGQEELEAQLAIKYRQHKLANPEQTSVAKPVGVFQIYGTNEPSIYDENDPAQVVKKYK